MGKTTTVALALAVAASCRDASAARAGIHGTSVGATVSSIVTGRTLPVLAPPINGRGDLRQASPLIFPSEKAAATPAPTLDRASLVWATEAGGAGNSGSDSPLETERSGAGAVFDVSARGKTLLLVGTLDSRPWILEESKRTAERLGLRLMLLDRPENRRLSEPLIPAADFIEADIWAHDPKTMARVVEKIAEAHRAGTIDAVYTFLNPFVELAGMIRDRIGAIGNTGASTAAAHTKSTARRLIAEKLPEYATPYAVVKDAAEARQAFGDIQTRMGRNVRVVMKPIHGGGSQGVKVDIASPEEAAAAYAEIDAFLLEFKKRPDAGFEMLDTHPGIMMELMLEGPEVDVEIGKGRGRLLWGRVLDNAPMDRPHAVEKNVAAPSRLPAAAQAALVASASKIVSALGLELGNFHVEMMMTPEGPRLLEVNARMGGATVASLVGRVFGINLIDSGIRALFGLEIDPGHEPSVSMESRFIIPQVTGTIVAVEGLEEARGMAGIEQVHISKKVGERQIAAPADTFDYVGHVNGVGKDSQQAFARTLEALRKVRIKVLRPDGTIFEQGADFSHAPEDP